MDMRIFAPAPDEDIFSYGPPENFELHGKSFSAEFDSGERVNLEFPASNGSQCMKIKDAIWLVVTKPPQPAAVFVVDLEASMVTRAVASTAGGFELSFGVLDGASGNLHKLTDDLAGNTVEWTLGMNKASLFEVFYRAQDAVLTCPLLPDIPSLCAEHLRVAKITDTVYLQTAVITGGQAPVPVCMLSDFHRVLCVGCAIMSDGAARLIGGHGLYPKDRKFKAQDTASGAIGIDLHTLSPFGNVSIYQYLPPSCFELAGQTIKLIMDDGYDFTLNFLDNETLEWNFAGKTPAAAQYMCVKADNTTYLLNYELTGIKPRANHTFVIDFEKMLVTRMISRIGTNPRWPYLMKTDFEFGAIDDGSEYKTYPRHGFTSDLIGTIAQWQYASEMTTLHAYHCSDFYRLTHARDRVPSKEEAVENYAFTDFQSKLPSTDEPTNYVKIKDGMYLVSITEKNGEKLLGSKMVFRSNTLCFLQNYKRGYVVSRGFGTSTLQDGTDTETNNIIGAYGRAIEASDDELKALLTDPNPYLV